MSLVTNGTCCSVPVLPIVADRSGDSFDPAIRWSARSIVHWRGLANQSTGMACKCNLVSPALGELTMHKGKAASRAPPDRASVFGINGVGVQVAILLSHSGVSSLTLIDPRRVPPRGQQRLGFDRDDSGRRRVDALADHCHRINPQLDLRTIERLGKDCSPEIVFVCDPENCQSPSVTPACHQSTGVSWQAINNGLLIAAGPVRDVDDLFASTNKAVTGRVQATPHSPVLASLIASLVVGLAFRCFDDGLARSLHIESESLKVTPRAN